MRGVSKEATLNSKPGEHPKIRFSHRSFDQHMLIPGGGGVALLSICCAFYKVFPEGNAGFACGSLRPLPPCWKTLHLACTVEP